MYFPYSFWNSALLDKMISYYKLSDELDSLNRNNLSFGSASFVAGKISNCLRVDNASNYLYSASNSSLCINSDKTIILWAKNVGVGTSYFLSKFENITSDYYFQHFFGSEYVSFGVCDSGGTPSFTADVNMSDNVWTFLVARIYYNEDKFSLQSDNGSEVFVTSVGGFNQTSSEFSIGNNQYNIFESSLDCYVDEVGIWNRVLTLDETTFLYNGGNGKTYPFS